MARDEAFGGIGARGDVGRARAVLAFPPRVVLTRLVCGQPSRFRAGGRREEEEDGGGQ